MVLEDITGYVDAIDGLKTSRTPQAHVYKFVISNGEGTRVKVFIWGTKMARRYEEQIQMWSVVELVGVHVRTSNLRYRDPDVHKLEFHVQPSSKITILGTFTPGSVGTGAAVYRSIAMEEVAHVDGLTEIDCYVRTRFRLVHFNRSTCGQGQVTDGNSYRLTVNIASYTHSELLVIGTAITIKGEMGRDPPFFRVVNMDDIIIRQGVPALTREQVASGFHPVHVARRPRLEDVQVNHAGNGQNVNNADNGPLVANYNVGTGPTTASNNADTGPLAANIDTGAGPSSINGAAGAFVADGAAGAFVANGAAGAFVANGVDGALVANGVDGALVANGVDRALVANGSDGAFVANGADSALVANGADEIVDDGTGA